MTDLTALSTIEAAAAIGKGDIRSAELVAACLARVKAREGDIKAWAYLDPDHAMAQAKAADDAQRSGRGVGALNGVPVAIKDIIDTADMPTEHGTPVFKGNRPTADAHVVARLRDAGAVILGKTITTELATLTPNVTHNPHNIEHTPGGSSSGSAAAVADHMVPAALGTQTGGSVIRPGSFCGIHGFKPSFGFIGRTGVMGQAQSLDTVGVYGRSVEDLALLADVLSGFDARDAASINASRPNLLATATAEWTLPPHFVFLKTPGWKNADPVLHEAFGELVEGLGSQVEEISLDMTIEQGLADARVVQNAELAQHYGPFLDRAPELISKRLAGQIEEGRQIKAADYLTALARREKLYRSVAEILTNHGTILTPSAPGPAPKGLGSTGNPVFNSFWTYMGTPAVTLPLLATEDGLPIGVQLVGARRDDGRLLRTARQLERQLAV